MKKILSILFALFIFFEGNAQVIRASVGPGTQTNRIKVYLKADVTQASTISTLQFNVGVVAAGITTAPTLTLKTQALAFGATVWTVTPGYLEGGYWNYNIFTSASPLTPSFTANTDFEAMELEFSNGVPSTGTVGLVTLPDGGAQAGALFYCTGSVNSNGLSNLYYAISGGATLDNQNSYDPNGGAPGTAISIITIPNVVLPVRFLNFAATKSNNTAILNWAVENEDANTLNYEILKSVNGVDFTSMATLPAVNNGRSSNSYAYTVENLSGIRSSGVIYFRIKQTDKDGKFVYTDIKSVRLNSKGLIAAVYPNPVKNSANLSFDLDQNSDVTVSLITAEGKQIFANQLQGIKGSNITKVDMSKVATGNYSLRIQAGSEVKVIPVVKAQN